MSIIQEALKKSKNIPPADDYNTKVSPKGIRGLLNMRPRNKSIALLFYILAGVVFIFYIFALFRSPSAPGAGSNYSARLINGVKRSAPVIKPLTGEAASQAAGVPAKAFRARSRFPDFILNGIMQLVDGPRAIINNVIVGIDDVIGGATVKKINKDNVVLRTADSEITLKMR